MAGTKRSAPVDETARSTRSSKVTKTTEGSSPKDKATNGGKKGIKANLSPSAFKSKALPLHINITHTPPVIREDDSIVPSSDADPGFIASATLLPSVFATGSYGWKGNKRVTIELPNPEGGEGEKLQVMITINAAVIGSKQAGKDEERDETKEETEETEDAGENDGTTTVKEDK